MPNGSTSLPGFDHLGLSTQLLRAIAHLGYETPTSIQEQTIAPMLAGKDILGQAQTGTGKTAAFALPLLNYLDPHIKSPQVLVLTPTRELAIQDAEAFEQFSAFMNGVSILPVYGGADMRAQTRALKKGVQIVVGTPGRIMDHMRRETLKLDAITSIVLDEADEMLQMGFQEDVEWILERAPKKRQMALFSATISTAIRQIAKKFMDKPQEITIRTKTSTAATINQRYWLVSGMHKLDALTRILEAETCDGVIVFVKTRAATVSLAEELVNRGFNAAPLNGEIPQHLRERTIESLKAKRIHILVATDVAARGLDVDRISHVINYDVPHDAEAYIHRVGRTGRAGRKGEAILFLAQRERSMLKVIEKETRQGIEPYQMPRPEQINRKRIDDFKKKIVSTVASSDLALFARIVEELQTETGMEPLKIAAATASLLNEVQPLLQPEIKTTFIPELDKHEPRGSNAVRPKRERVRERTEEYTMVQYRVEVGHAHGVKPGNLVGAIANEAGLDGSHVGKIIIGDDYSTIDLPAGMPIEVMQELGKVKVVGQPLMISLNTSRQTPPRAPKQRELQRRNGKMTRTRKAR